MLYGIKVFLNWWNASCRMDCKYFGNHCTLKLMKWYRVKGIKVFRQSLYFKINELLKDEWNKSTKTLGSHCILKMMKKYSVTYMINSNKVHTFHNGDSVTQSFNSSQTLCDGITVKHIRTAMYKKQCFHGLQYRQYLTYEQQKQAWQETEQCTSTIYCHVSRTIFGLLHTYESV